MDYLDIIKNLIAISIILLILYAFRKKKQTVDLNERNRKSLVNTSTIKKASECSSMSTYDAKINESHKSKDYKQAYTSSSATVIDSSIVYRRTHTNYSRENLSSQQEQLLVAPKNKAYKFEKDNTFNHHTSKSDELIPCLYGKNSPSSITHPYLSDNINTSWYSATSIPKTVPFAQKESENNEKSTFSGWDNLNTTGSIIVAKDKIAPKSESISNDPVSTNKINDRCTEMNRLSSEKPKISTSITTYAKPLTPITPFLKKNSKKNGEAKKDSLDNKKQNLVKSYIASKKMDGKKITKKSNINSKSDSNMEADDEKENGVSDMDGEDFSFVCHAPAIDSKENELPSFRSFNLQKMDIEHIKKYPRTQMLIAEDNMNIDSENDSEVMINDEDMFDAQYVKKNSIKDFVDIHMKVASLPKTKPDILKTNFNQFKDGLQFRKTLQRVTVNNDQKVFVPKHIPVVDRHETSYRGIRIRHCFDPFEAENENTKKKHLLGLNTRSDSTSSSTCDKKRVLITDNTDDDGTDNCPTIMKRIIKEDEKGNFAVKSVDKKKDRWNLIKIQMKNKSQQVKSLKSESHDLITQMVSDKIEVSGIDCDNCQKRFSYLEYTWCPNSDKICLNCITGVIRDTLNHKKLHLSCPKDSCKATIDLDSLSKKVDPVTVELLRRKLQKWLEKTHNEAFEQLFGKFSCPQCNIPTAMDIEKIHFTCTNCRLELCTYCHQFWLRPIGHEECRLLNLSGQKCFNDTNSLPSNWTTVPPVIQSASEMSIDVPSLSDISLHSSEGKSIIQLFIRGSRGTRILSITRIQIIKLWEKYVLKRKHMVDEIGLSNIHERVLFHGTDSVNIPLISSEGFDMRVQTANGAVFGKGIYFSSSSQYSMKYARGCKKMFMARVLCGYSAVGTSGITRPPKHHSGRMYDSCVNDIKIPTIYCLFDNAQCYPAYIITYS